MTNIVTDIIEILVSGIAQYAQGFGEGLAALLKSVFLTGTGTTSDPYALSITGGVVCAFAAIGLAVGLSRVVWNFVSSLGARK